MPQRLAATRSSDTSFTSSLEPYTPGTGRAFEPWHEAWTATSPGAAHVSSTAALVGLGLTRPNKFESRESSCLFPR
jgi:hypothetical protein